MKSSGKVKRRELRKHLFLVMVLALIFGFLVTVFLVTAGAREIGDIFGVLVVVGLSFLVSVAVAWVASGVGTKEIKQAVEIARMIDSSSDVSDLPLSGVVEFDDLLHTVRRLGVSLADNASKMSTLMDIIGIPMGFFEVSLAQNSVFVTRSIYGVLGIESKGGAMPQFVALPLFERYIPQYKQAMDAGKTDMDFTVLRDGEEIWLEMHLARMSETRIVYGVIMDVTERVREKERLTYEYAYDAMTGLLNRNSYLQKIQSMIAAEPHKCGVFAFMDLDRLKVVNDTYGHNAGDDYLRMAGKAFAIFQGQRGVAARIAGDEFVVYLHGGDSVAIMKERVVPGLEKGRALNMELPDGGVMNLHFSTGLCYYPKDSKDPEQLLRYADFAMYEVKNSARGGIIDFDMDRYVRFDRKDDFAETSAVDTLLKDRDMRYAFQPIINIQQKINAKTPITFYEAVMRTGEQTPAEILDSATKEGKLYELELFLFESFCQWVDDNKDLLARCTVAFNSIPDQLLKDADFYHGLEQLKSAADRHVSVVMEINAKKYNDGELLERKARWARFHGLKVALDDYSGSLIENTFVVNFRPEYIKIAIDVIRGIHCDAAKQSVAQNALLLAATHGASVVAEGVETAEELRTLINLGVHYAQGFCFSPPEFTLLKHLPEHVVNLRSKD